MRLSIINQFDHVNTFLATYLLSEGVRGPWWPEAWATQIIRSKPFHDWLRSLGISGDIGQPMAGGVGRAFPVGDSHIVKLTTDKREANAAATLKGHQSQHAAAIYDVQKLGSFPDPREGGKKNADVFAIAMQRLNTGVGKRLRAAGNAVFAYLDDFPGFIENPVAAVRVVLDRYLGKHSNDQATRAAVKKVVYALYKLQQRTGVLAQDPHGGNMAFKGREPAFFDFGRSSIRPNAAKAI